jgi:replicative DNA helicase
VEFSKEQRKQDAENKRQGRETVKPQQLSRVQHIETNRLKSTMDEFDRVMGGGIVPGSVTLLAGDPGIGKSTLLLAILSKIGGVYVAGEESAEQVKLRAARLGISGDNIIIYPETSVERIVEMLKDETGKNTGGKQPLVIVDSMDIMKPNEGFTNSDYRDQAKIANEISALAKELDIPILSAMQANRAGREEDGVKKVLDKNRVADSYGKLRPLYGVYSINSKGGNDVILNKHFLFVNKNRNGPADVRANFIMNKMLMQVKDDVEIEDEEEQFE